MITENEKRVAVLVDLENMSPAYLETIINEANRFGKISIRRIYGDITKAASKSWVALMQEYSLTAIHQASSNGIKNSSDFALVIDTMEILYAFDIDIFCIVSKDSDFTRLATKLKEHNKTVVGMGESTAYSKALQKACDSYLFLDKVSPKNAVTQMDDDSKSKDKDQPKQENSHQSDIIQVIEKDDLYDVLRSIVEENAYDDGWAYWSEAHNQLQKKHPEFDPRNYGFNGKALGFFEKSEKFEFRDKTNPRVSIRYVVHLD